MAARAKNKSNFLPAEMQNQEKRITLRKLNRIDIKYFYVWASDPEVTESLTWNAYTSLEDAEKFLKEVAENHPWCKAICLDGVPIGSITLTPGKGSSACKAELGYVIARAFWGKGITTIAVKKAIESGFNDLGIRRVEALVDPENIASQKVLTKAGLKYEGLLKNYVLFKGCVRDRHMYALTNEVK